MEYLYMYKLYFRINPVFRKKHILSLFSTRLLLYWCRTTTKDTVDCLEEQ